VKEKFPLKDNANKSFVGSSKDYNPKKSNNYNPTKFTQFV
jgi:hypothetical protein